MISVVVLGGGNLAYHLISNLVENKAVSLVQVYNRSINAIAYLDNVIPITDNLNALKEADIYILAVSDNAITELSTKLKFDNKLVVHTSGSVSMKEIQSSKANKGVLYFLQSFTKNKPLDLSVVPVCIEAERIADQDLLLKLGKSISNSCHLINSEQRRNLHVAAVFVNNFVNHMYQMGHEICKSHKVPFETLIPLIKETASKIETLAPEQAQTGPAVRNDTSTIEKHKLMLTEHQKEIYSLLTKSIQNTYGKKL